MVKQQSSWSRLAIACLLVAGCGSDGEDGSTADTAGAGASSTSTGPAASSGGPGGSGGASGSSSGAGGSAGAGGSGAGGAALSFENDIWPILSMPRDPPLTGTNDSCSGANGCHFGSAGGLAMPDSSTAYANLVDAPSSSALCAAMLQVVASEPDQSCFVVFYEQRLRDQLGWVDQAETDVVRAWVEQGAAP
jgi:hypothetical protein